MEEYTIFKVTSSSGEEVELAVVDEFEVDHKVYVAAAIVKEDTIDMDEGIYIYKAKLADGELVTEKITDKDEYKAVAEAYMNMEG